MDRPVAVLPEELLPIVKQTARMMSRRGLNRDDAEDLEQAVTLRAWLSLPRYLPEKGPLGAYLQTVVKRAAANFLRDQRSGRRTSIGATSLRTGVAPPIDETDLSQSFTRAELDARTGGRSEDQFAAADCSIDVNELIKKLAPCDRALVQALKWRTISQIARAMNVPRTTVSDRVRRLRKRFDADGLREYLQ
jgi:RNA polymerase sigma factor (sigma-70 family)